MKSGFFSVSSGQENVTARQVRSRAEQPSAPDNAIGTAPRSGTEADRPECMQILGILPPYTLQDVKYAYLEKVRTVHPDVGGNQGEFLLLQEAFEQAKDYVEFRASRMRWLASQMDRYIAQSEIVEKIEAIGGRVTLQHIAWLQRAFGDDFAQVTETVTSIDLSETLADDSLAHSLAEECSTFYQLRRLDLNGTRVSNRGLASLRVYSIVSELDIRNTAVQLGALQVARWFPKLTRLGIDRGKVSPVDRLKLLWRRPRLQLVLGKSSF